MDTMTEALMRDLKRKARGNGTEIDFTKFELRKNTDGTISLLYNGIELSRTK